MSQEPLEIIAGPVELYIAPVGETMPDVTDEPPTGNWVLVGTSGADNTTEDGVTVQLTETLELFRGLGGTDVRKAFRTQEDMLVSLTLADMTLEEWARVLNFNTVSVDSNDNTIPLYKGGVVNCKALVVRGNDQSPNLSGGNIQWELPRVIPSGVPEVVFVKGVPAGLALEFMVVGDLNAASDSLRFGIIRVQQS